VPSRRSYITLRVPTFSPSLPAPAPAPAGHGAARRGAGGRRQCVRGRGARTSTSPVASAPAMASAPVAAMSPSRRRRQRYSPADGFGRVASHPSARTRAARISCAASSRLRSASTHSIEYQSSSMASSGGLHNPRRLGQRYWGGRYLAQAAKGRATRPSLGTYQIQYD